ncbi:hypothetical protein Aduo_005504 [Ancylostoma duodenale]
MRFAKYSLTYGITMTAPCSGVQNAEEALRSRMPFPASTVKAPKQKSQWAPDLLALELDLIREFRAVQTQPYKDNMTPTERRGLNEALRMRKSLRFSIGDKSGAFVVIDKEMDKQLATLTLSDASTYVRSNSNEFQVAFEELSRVSVRRTFSTPAPFPVGIKFYSERQVDHSDARNNADSVHSTQTPVFRTFCARPPLPPAPRSTINDT